MSGGAVGGAGAGGVSADLQLHVIEVCANACSGGVGAGLNAGGSGGLIVGGGGLC